MNNLLITNFIKSSLQYKEKFTKDSPKCNPLNLSTRYHMKNYIGIDISKSTIDVYDGKKSYKFENNEQGFKKLVSLSSVDAVRVAFGLGIPVYNFYDIPLSDYRTNFKKALPQAKLTIPLSTKMFKPFVVPNEVILRFGLEKDQIIEYQFIDPLIWLKDFKFDKNYVEKIYQKYNINRQKFTILIREEEYKASYVRKKYPFLYESLKENILPLCLHFSSH